MSSDSLRGYNTRDIVYYEVGISYFIKKKFS